MKVLLINTFESRGGAAVACKRLAKALNKQGIEINMLVLKKTSNDEMITGVVKGKQTELLSKMTFLLERVHIYLINRFSKKNLFAVSTAGFGIAIHNHELVRQADIIHFHWINQGFLTIGEIGKLMRLGKPVVWTFHDMWPFTGVCHHAHTCDNYTQKCGNCPFLFYPSNNDLSANVLKKKKDCYGTSLFEVVTVSNWLANKARESSLLKNHNITVIPNTLPLELFQKKEKISSRKEIGLPLGKKIFIFCSAKIDDPIKGFDFLVDALVNIKEKVDLDKVHLVLIGQIKSDKDFPATLPVSTTKLGGVDEAMLPKIYSSADVLVAPSLYETFGQTIIEAQSCGCVPVCFNNSGQTDIIIHKETGYLAEYLSVESLGNGIIWALNEVDIEQFTRKSMDNIKNYCSEDVVASKYLELYKELLHKN